MLDFRELSKPRRAGRAVAATIAASGIAVLAILGANAGAGNPFGGSDGGVDSAVNAGSSIQLDESVSRGSYTLTATAMIADELQTVVEIELSGLAGGTAVYAAGRPFLLAPSGDVLYLESASSDAGNRAAMTLVFPPLPRSAGEVDLVMPALKAGVPNDASDATLLEGGASWVIEFNWNGEPGSVARVSVGTEVPFGSGILVVESAERTSSAIRVVGHISGYSVEEQSQFIIVPAILDNHEGVSVTQLRGSHGSGPEGTAFELWFEPISGDQLTLTVPMNASMHSRASIGESIGQEASVTFAAP